MSPKPHPCAYCARRRGELTYKKISKNPQSSCYQLRLLYKLKSKGFFRYCSRFLCNTPNESRALIAGDWVRSEFLLHRGGSVLSAASNTRPLCLTRQCLASTWFDLAPGVPSLAMKHWLALKHAAFEKLRDTMSRLGTSWSFFVRSGTDRRTHRSLLNGVVPCRSREWEHLARPNCLLYRRSLSRRVRS